MQKPHSYKSQTRLQETKKIILVKKEPTSKQNEGPIQLKVMLKPRPKESAQPSTSSSGTISNPVSSSSSASQHANKLKGAKTVEEANPRLLKKMINPVDIINSNHTIIGQSLDYLSDTNTDFFVIGVLGPQNIGKSSILNLLTSVNNAEYSLFNSTNSVFRVRSRKNCGLPTSISESIQMYVTSDRIILLDSPGLFCNKYKKDCVQHGLDDLKIISLLLSVCHLVLVVVDNCFNTNLIRYLQCAEMMIPSHDKHLLNNKLANIMFVKNKSKNYLPNDTLVVHKYFKQLFKHSKLKIFLGNSMDSNDRSSVNYFIIPCCKPAKDGIQKYEEYIDINSIIQEFRNRVFMSSRYNNEKQEILTEKQWSAIFITVWETQKSNYFMRKYQNLLNQYCINPHNFNDRGDC